MTRDQRRYQALYDLGCVCCLKRTGQYVPPQIHHLVDKGYRKHSGGNQSTVPLCPFHHQGLLPEGRTYEQIRSVYGPSMFHEAKEFARIFGSQRDLLAMTNEMLSGVKL